MVKHKRVKESESVVPHVRVWYYFFCYETLPSKVLAAVGAARVRKNSMVMQLPRPITESEQLRDVERRLQSKIEGNPEVILVDVSFLGEDLRALTPEQASHLEAMNEEIRKRKEAVAAMKDGVAEVVAPKSEANGD